jgi:hypothetical protein
MRRFFELQRKWPEIYLSIVIGKVPGSSACHLDVYERPCDESYLQGFCINRYKDGGLPDVVPNNNGWLIVSPEFCRALMDVDADVKAFTTPIVSIVPEFCPDVLKNYSLVSAARVVNCIDVTNPEMDWYDGKHEFVKSYRSLRFHNDKIPPRFSFFGLKIGPCVHIISDAVHDNIVRSNLTGVSFRECELK